MLVLSRRVDQEIVIGNKGEITLIVLSINGNHVRLGIKAPPEVTVDRKEERLRKERHKEDSIRALDPANKDLAWKLAEKDRRDQQK